MVPANEHTRRVERQPTLRHYYSFQQSETTSSAALEGGEVTSWSLTKYSYHRPVARGFHPSDTGILPSPVPAGCLPHRSSPAPNSSRSKRNRLVFRTSSRSSLASSPASFGRANPASHRQNNFRVAR